MNGRPVRYRELALFNRALAEMLRSAVPLPVALARASAEVAGRGPRQLLAEVERAARDGASLAQALEPHRDRLPELYLRMVAAGSAAGNLAEVLAQFAAYAESRLAFERKMGEATAYPKLVLAFFAPILVLLVFVVGPELMRMTERGGMVPGSPGLSPGQYGALKSILAAVDAASTWAVANPIGAAGIAGIALFGVPALLRAVAGRRLRAAFGRLRLSLPFVGPIAYHGTLALILRGLGSLVRAGIPLPEALRLAAAATALPAARASLERLSARTADGERLSDGLGTEPFFPPYAAWLLAKDEGGPEFASALGDAADHYEARMESRVEALKILVLPTAEVILGLVVLGCYFTFVLPVIAPPRDREHWQWSRLSGPQEYVQDWVGYLRDGECVRKK